MPGTPSGRFLLRTPAALHAALRRAARARRLSLNQYCLERLSAPPASAPTAATALVARVAAAFDGHVEAVVVYGSWARGEASTDSDVDVLVVLDPAVPLAREVYRRLDDGAIAWDGHPVQIQVVHPPPTTGLAVGGLWPEIALDGIVLFERGYALSRRLVSIRRAIADGRLVRRTAHGQPYWTAKEAA